MTIRQAARGLVFLAIFGVQAVALAEAGPRLQTVAPQPNWGIVDASVYPLTAWDFELTVAATPWAVGEELYRFRPDGASGGLLAGVHLPAGALVTGLAVEACDTSDTGGVSATLYWCPAGTMDPCLNAGVATGDATSPGCGVFEADLTGFDIVIDNSAESYVLSVTTGATGQSNMVRGVRLYYRLQISPAPAQATFGDVPTDHPFFQFIEALVASGITAGCGGGDYCPDNPVTRGQMAVFFAKALGLHWD
jgi:hypothetical protein